MSYSDERISDLKAKPNKTTDEKEELRFLLEWMEYSNRTYLSGAGLRRKGELFKKFDYYMFRDFLHAMANRGYSFACWAEFEDETKQLTGKQIEAVLDLIPSMEHKAVQGSLVRQVALTKRVYNATPLTRLYDKCEPEDSTRWTIGDAISRSKAKGIDDWVRDKLANPDEGTGWNRLCEYAAKHFPAQEAIDLIKPLEDRAPFDVPHGLGICGGAEELVYLEAMLERNKARGKSGIRNEIKKAIRKIEKRLSKKQ